MEIVHSDALVFFGAAGDLAFKRIFPALLGLVAEEGVDVPIVGVAKAGRTVEQLRARTKDSSEHHAPRLLTAAARTGLRPAPESRSRWAYHLLLHRFTPRFSVQFIANSFPCLCGHGHKSAGGPRLRQFAPAQLAARIDEPS
jgi:hypothetical protein